jgi:ABC-type antimicrobial peptide transport system permease subunit
LDYFAIGVAVCWLATNFINIAVYIGDARRQELPLVSPFGIEDVIHDWNYLLGKTGLLNFDAAIAWLVRLIGILTMLAGLVFCGWLVLIMIRTMNTTSTGE